MFLFTIMIPMNLGQSNFPFFLLDPDMAHFLVASLWLYNQLWMPSPGV
jgi:hypothetical protein